MGIRWRKDGTLVCSAMSEAEKGDTYIDGRLSYELTARLQVVIADPEHKMNGLWYWARDALIVANPLWPGLQSRARLPSGLRSFVLRTMSPPQKS